MSTVTTNAPSPPPFHQKWLFFSIQTYTHTHTPYTNFRASPTFLNRLSIRARQTAAESRPTSAFMCRINQLYNIIRAIMNAEAIL